MKLIISRRFKKSYTTRIKPYPKLDKIFAERITLFLTNPQDPRLRDHKLIGKKQSFRAFSITGDVRVIYSQESKDTILLLDIGTHNQVYA